jgi:putative hydrolase of the HAD superfamily
MKGLRSFFTLLGKNINNRRLCAIGASAFGGKPAARIKDKMQITTVFLDAGGVILDETEHEQVRAEVAVEVLNTVVPEYSVSHYLSDVEEAVRVFCPSVYQYVFWKTLKQDMSLFDQLYAAYLGEWRQRKPVLKLSEGLESELKLLCNEFKLGIAGQYGRELLQILEENSILEYFTYRLTQDDFATTKPDLRFFESIVRRCGTDPRECIMVGDRIDKDIIPAKLMGMKTILIRTGLHKNQQPRIPFEVPHAELGSLAGLAETVSGLAFKTEETSCSD